MVEVKNSDNQGISKALHKFKEELNVDHALQVALNKPFVNIDCFNYKKPIIVSAKTFLSQLV